MAAVLAALTWLIVRRSQKAGVGNEGTDNEGRQLLPVSTFSSASPSEVKPDVPSSLGRIGLRGLESRSEDDSLQAAELPDQPASSADTSPAVDAEHN